MFAEIPNKPLGNRYLLHDRIGQGGMGVVYHAYDRLTGREVALKRVLTDANVLSLSDSESVLDFKMSLAQEFKLSASLRHPNIITVLDYGFDEEQQPYYTMELLKQPQTILDASATASVADRMNLIVQMLHALTYLHRRGILHRDIKPANVLVEAGCVKILDFGLSTMHQRSQQQDQNSQMTVGTLGYMAPEVLYGDDISFAADIYAVGMIAYEILAQKHPFALDEPAQLVNDILMTVPDYSIIEADAALVAVIRKMLQKEPDDRYANADDVVQALIAASDVNIGGESKAIRESFLQAARLVGRDFELNLLTQALDTAAKGQGSGWLIAGESGVGKSRLVDELRTQAMVRGAVVMRGQAVKIGSQPYQIWQMVFRWLVLLSDALTHDDLNLLRAIIPDVDQMLKDNEPSQTLENAPAKQLQGDLLQLLVRVLRAYNKPVVIILEDLHWLGEASHNLLKLLSAHLPELPLLVLATYRDDEMPKLYEAFQGFTRLDLQRLSNDQISELSAAMLGEAGRSQHVVDLLQRETEGNVFFVVEVVRALAEEVGQLDQIGRVTLPSKVFAGGVQTVVQRRLDRLDERSRSLLAVAAVMGRELDVTVITALAKDVDIQEWLTTCAQVAVLAVASGEWSFAHDKIRLSLLETLNPQQRQNLHSQVAEAIKSCYGESEARVSALAYHYQRAGDQQQEEHYVTLAGEQALRTGAYREAIVYFQRAEDILKALDWSDQRKKRKRVHLNQRVGDANLGMGAYDEAGRYYQASLDLMRQLDDPVGIAVSTGHLGNVAFAKEEFVEAQGLYRDALKRYRIADNHAGIVRTLNQLGDVAYELGDQEKAKQYYQESLQLSREIGADWGMAGALRTRVVPVVNLSNEPTQEKSVLEALLQEQRSKNDLAGMATTLYELGVVAQSMREFQTAQAYFEQALDHYERLLDAVGITQAQQRLGALAADRQEFLEAQTCYRSALRAAIKTDQPNLPLDILFSMAQLMIAQSEGEQALELLAFLLHFQNSPEALQDKVEQLIFVLEDELPPEIVERRWEAGKQRRYEDVLQDALLDN